MTYPSDAYDCSSDVTCVKSIVHRGFGLFWENKRLLIGAHLILLAILLGGDFLLRGVGGNVLLGPFLLGVYKINLSLVRNKDAELSDILSGFEQFLPAFLANIIIHLIAFVGFWFLVIPGLLVFLTYSTTYLFLLEGNPGFWDAMTASRTMTWANKKLWLSLGLVILVINIAGAACFLVGLAATIPFSHLVITLAYEEEKKRSAAVTSPAEEVDEFAETSPL